MKTNHFARPHGPDDKLDFIFLFILAAIFVPILLMHLFARSAEPAAIKPPLMAQPVAILHR